MNTDPAYETLDPENWDEMRALAHRMVDDALTYLETVRERPVWQPIPERSPRGSMSPLRMNPPVQRPPIRNFWKPSCPTPWEISILAFGDGIWATAQYSARWPILCLRS